MDPVSALQTVSAAFSITKELWETFEKVKEIKDAPKEAETLFNTSKSLAILLENVKQLLQRRAESQGPNGITPFEARVLESTNDVCETCRKGTKDLARKCLGLGNGEPIQFTSKVAKSVRYTLSARSIQKLERSLQMNILSMQTSLDLLGFLDNEHLQERMKRLELTKAEAISCWRDYPDQQHLQSKQRLGTTLQQGNTSPGLSKKNLSTHDAQLAADPELLGLQSLKRCIEFAEQVYSCSGSTSSLEAGSISNGLSTVDDVQSGVEQHEERSRILEENLDSYSAVAMNDLAGHSRIRSRTNGSEDYPSEALEWSLRACIERSETDFDDGNLSATEPNVVKAIIYGERLEQRGDRPFIERFHLRKRVADIYMMQERFAEAAQWIQPLFTSDESIEQAGLYFLLAKIWYTKHVKLKNHDRDEAIDGDLARADGFVEKSFSRYWQLYKSGVIGKDHPDLLECVGLIVDIFEDKGDMTEASEWRRQFNLRKHSDSTRNSTDGISSQSSQHEHTLEAESVSRTDDQDRTPLIDSVVCNLPEKFQELLDSDVDIDEHDAKGRTALMYAAECRHDGSCDDCAKVILKLAEKGADLNLARESTNDTALHLAIRYDNLQAARALLRAGAEVDASSPSTPLALAVRHNKAESVNLLLDFRAKANVVDSDGWTLLHHAIKASASNALAILLERRSSDNLDLDLNARCINDRTPLMQLTESPNRSEPRHLEMTRALIENGAEVNVTAGGEQDIVSALYFAADGPYTKQRGRLVKLLLESGADVQIVRDHLPKRFAQYPAFKQYAFDSGRRDSVISGHSNSQIEPDRGHRSSSEASSNDHQQRFRSIFRRSKR
ncbi:ankyrin [Rhizodiscina lignyota]|uniref:Ankyrin n=1 Tax=Rhizodiscina lignyota TaxID=1504668 RepID=A0A9P4IGC7_9PEZI|nr:ankyrin [Rhizodiscina lignyota]